ncbi:MAG: ATP-binding cassette domain-containing protein [Cyanobium sp.]
MQLPELLHRYPNLELRQDWSRVLSLGEQQRLAFARLLLHAPRFVLLDEATSALDLATEAVLYDALVRTRSALVSVAHRPTLRRFHGRLLELDGSGAWHLE